uniref:Putative tcf3 fusion partner n=1 Tax=Ixodes ricinus TaxID=34613 RepID=A0A6B0UB58_IXORI
MPSQEHSSVSSHVSRTSRPTQYGTPKHPRVAKPHSKNHHHHLKNHRRGTKTMKRCTSFRSTVKARRHFGGHPQRLTETDQIELSLKREKNKKKNGGWR